MSSTPEGQLLQRIVASTQRSAGGVATRQQLVEDYLARELARSVPTPMIELTTTVAGRPRRIYLKLEGHSRWKSIKGRTALALMASIAHRVGDRTTVVESTSGNLGVALAGTCAELGIAFTAVVDSRLQPGLRARMRRLRARVVTIENTADGNYLQRRIARVRELLAGDNQAIWTNQYDNKANVAVHRWWTGPELGRQLPADARVVFAPVSTGGSFTGMRDYLACDHPDIECVAVDVRGSIIFGGVPAARLLTGIGASKPSTFLDPVALPAHVMVSDAEAISACRALLRDTGVGVGGSSGAVLVGCLRFLRDRPDLEAAICICPDLAANYQETLYDDEWLSRSGLTEALSGLNVDGAAIRFARPSTPIPDWTQSSSELWFAEAAKPRS